MDKQNENIKHGWIKKDDSSLFFTNPDYKGPSVSDTEKLCKALISDIKKFSPNAKKVQRTIVSDAHLLVVDPADVHIGKLCSSFEAGEDYNNQIAVKRVFDGISGILGKLNGVEIDKIVLVIGNDILHVDTPNRTTTAGTPQDTDGMWYNNFLIAKKLYTDVIKILLDVADVHVMYNPSNHDYVHGFFLAEVVRTYFMNNSQVSFDCSIAHRKAFMYGENLIGTTHGDGAKTADLPLLMAQEFSKEWAHTRHRYVYTHHLHHKVSKDFAGITVEGLRSPSGADSWHHRNGYEHCPKAIEGFVHHKSEGQVMRITHLF